MKHELTKHTVALMPDLELGNLSLARQVIISGPGEVAYVRDAWDDFLDAERTALLYCESGGFDWVEAAKVWSSVPELLNDLAESFTLTLLDRIGQS